MFSIIIQNIDQNVFNMQSDLEDIYMTEMLGIETLMMDVGDGQNLWEKRQFYRLNLKLVADFFDITYWIDSVNNIIITDHKRHLSSGSWDNLQSLPWYKNACKKGIFDAQSFVDKPDFEWNTRFVICWEESQGYKIRITFILDIGFINVSHKSDF